MPEVPNRFRERSLARIVRGMKTIALTLLTLVSLASSAVANPTTYEIDLKQSELVVILRKGGVASRLGHDHAVAATQFTGTVVYDPADVTKTTVKIDVKTDSLQADDPKLCKKHGVKNTASVSDRKTINANLRTEDQLWVKKYPTLTFRSRKFVQVGKHKATYIQGYLTIRGKKKLISCLIKLELKNKQLRAQCVFKIVQSDFGYTPYSALMGAIKVKDAAQIKVDITAVIPKKKPAKKKKTG